MSFNATMWAFQQPVRPATRKYVLVAMASFASNGDWLCYPSVAAVCQRTSLDRKTVLRCLDSLVKDGLIQDTKERRGDTRQVKVYQLQRSQERDSLRSPQIGTVIEPQKDPELGTVKESQNGNSSESGTVPLLPGKSPKFPTKESQISAERVPNLGHGISQGISQGICQGTIARTARSSGKAKNSEQEEPDPEVQVFMDGWIEAYEPTFGRVYVPKWGYETKLVKDLRRVVKLSADQLLEVARRAWASKTFWCQKAVTVATFCSRWNEITAELSGQSKTVNKVRGALGHHMDSASPYLILPTEPPE